MRLFSSRKAQLEQKAREPEEREARLIQREQQSVQPEEISSAPPGPQNSKERFYDKIPVTVRQLDIFIGLCIAAFVLVVLIGALQGQG